MVRFSMYSGECLDDDEDAFATGSRGGTLINSYRCQYFCI
jgi:hypothetical protein